MNWSLAEWQFATAAWALVICTFGAYPMGKLTRILAGIGLAAALVGLLANGLGA
jgi:hypothetical protein